MSPAGGDVESALDACFESLYSGQATFPLPEQQVRLAAVLSLLASLCMAQVQLSFHRHGLQFDHRMMECTTVCMSACHLP